MVTLPNWGLIPDDWNRIDVDVSIKVWLLRGPDYAINVTGKGKLYWLYSILKQIHTNILTSNRSSSEENSIISFLISNI